MRWLLASLWLAPLTAGLLACGGAVKAHGSSSGSPRSGAGLSDASAAKGAAHGESLAAPVSGDSDGDSAERAAFDNDDFHSMHFGHLANPGDERAIAAVVRHYYDALAREDGATVCSLLLEVVAESLPESESEKVPSSSASGARGCPAAISKALAQSHRALIAEARTLRVILVRVRRRRASAILRFAGRAARHLLLYKEEGSWKIGTLADEDLG